LLSLLCAVAPAVAAAAIKYRDVIKYRGVALDELHLDMKTYSTKLAACTTPLVTPIGSLSPIPAGCSPVWGIS
jgi:hypothetical protein